MYLQPLNTIASNTPAKAMFFMAHLHCLPAPRTGEPGRPQRQAEQVMFPFSFARISDTFD